MSLISLPSGALAWPHMQRLAQRGLRRWGYALAGLAMGLGGVWLAQPEVGESYDSALQAHARLSQQLAELRSSAAGPTPAKVAVTTGESEAQAQRLLRRLSVSTRPESLWTAWQQTLATHGLRLVLLQPMPSTGTEGRGAGLVSHAAAWRVLGRFDDWVRVWAACAESGPVCALDRINVVATQQPGEVQIDAVMRVWMRSAEGQVSDALDLADWMVDVQKGTRPSAHSRTALFAPSHSSEADLNTPRADALVPPTRSKGLLSAGASLSAISDDPKEWPLARIRLAGIWQQGAERQALVSAGPHVVRVVLGQRISLEGHRVAAITDHGVHLRLGKGPTLELPWAEVSQAGGSGGQSTSVSAGPSLPSIHSGHTKGSSPP
jgi:Tfp pilus assembly protein PilP